MKFQAVALAAVTTTALAEPRILFSTDTIRPETAITVSFDHAVAAQDKVNTVNTNDLLKITPQWPGQIKWTSTNTLEFLPSEAPKMFANYSFELKKGLKQLDGKAITGKSDKLLGSRNAEKFKVNYSRTYGSLRSNRSLATYLRFNDDVKPRTLKIYYKDVAGNVVLAQTRQATWADLESSYYVKPNWSDRFADILKIRAGQKVAERKYKPEDIIKNGVMVTPSSPLPVGSKWYLYVDSGSANAAGSEKTDYKHLVNIGSLSPLDIRQSSATVYADEPRRIYLTFNSSLPKKLTHEQLAKLITLSPEPDNVEFVRSSSSTIRINGDFSKHNKYEVVVDKKFTSSNGLTLKSNKVENVEFKHIAPSVGLPSYALAQLSKGSRTYSIDSVNMKSLHLRVKMMNSKEAVRAYLGYQQYSDSYNAKNASLNYGLISGETVVNKVIELDNPIDTSKEILLNWDDIIPNKDENAVFFVSVVATPKDELTGTHTKKHITQSLVQLTDIGLAWKQTLGQTWVYAYSCETGLPLAGVDISIQGEDANVLHSNKTDKDGLCLVERNADSERCLVAKLGDDTSIIRLSRSLNTVSMWSYPIDYSRYQPSGWDRDVMLFTDRNLYRPSETVRLKGILREFNDTRLRLGSDKEAKYTIKDPQRKTIKTGTLNISQNGHFDHEFDLPAEKVGHYRVYIEFENNDKNDERDAAFSIGFNVQEFRRNAFEIISNLPQPKPATDKVQLDLTAHYYQGTPLAKGQLDWYFSATPTGFYPDRFRDFHFGDHRKHDAYYWSYYFGYNDADSYDRVSSMQNGKAELSDDGEASVVVDIPEQEFPTPRKLSFISEVTDSRDQTLTNTSHTTLHPATSYYGISRVDQLVRADQAFDLDLIHVGLDGKLTGVDSNMTLSVVREYYESVKIQNSAGKETVKNEKRIEKLGEQVVPIIGSKVNTLPFTAEKPGRYILTLSGSDADDNLTMSATSFYVYGKDEYPWATEDGVRVKLVSEKKSYKPGETARILVMTPIEGTALVTIERQGVIRHMRRKLVADNPVIEIPIEAGDAPNAYVSVLLIRGSADSKREIKEPALKLGICDITVENPDKKLKVQMALASDYHRPGESITVNGIVTNHQGNPISNADVTIFAEDEGILAVMGYQSPRPFSHFYRKRPLTVSTGVSLGYFLTENSHHRYYGNKGFVIGGGGESASSPAEGKQLEMKLRTNFDPCAFWFPSVRTNSKGEFTITTKLPDTLTRYRIMANATSGAELFGAADTSVVVKKELMLEPKAPRFANEGDSLNPKVLVQNTSQYNGQWDITLTTDSLAQHDENSSKMLTKTISLNAGGSATLTFPVTMLDTGETTWKWSAIPRSLDSAELTPILSYQLSDSMQSKFTVNYPRPLLRHSDMITLKTKQIKAFNKVDPRLMNGRGHGELHFSNSLLLESGAAAEYLLRYPYGCVEQTTSSLMPWFAVDDLREYMPAFKAKNEAEVAKAIQLGADRLLTMLTPSGGLSYWPNGTKAEDWATSYGGLGLIMAKDQGANVPDSAIASITQYLSKMVKTRQVAAQQGWQSESITRALYVLALSGSDQSSTLNRLYGDRKILSNNARLYLALAFHHSRKTEESSPEAAELLRISRTEPKTKENRWMRHSAYKSLILLASSEIAPTSDEPDKAISLLLAEKNNRGHWRTTWANGWALNAMASYARNVEAKRGDVAVNYSINGEGKQITLTRDKPTHSLSLSLSEAESLIVASSSNAYMRVEVAAKPELAPAGSEIHNGMKIDRSYERINADGKAEPLTNPKVGDLVKVNLEVTFPRSMYYVVIEDLLPSVMETVNGDFASQKAHVADPTKSNWSVSRRELRNDRAVFFLNRSWGNKKQTISYLARVTNAGSVHLPAAKVEAMYEPASYGLSASSMFTAE